MGIEPNRSSQSALAKIRGTDGHMPSAVRMTFLRKNLFFNASVLDDRLVAELIHRMSLMLESAVLSIVILPLAVVIALWGQIDHYQLMLWSLLEFTWTIDRYWTAKRYLRLKPPAAQARRWARRYTLNVLASGTTWGVACAWFFVEGSLPHQMLLISMVMGLSAGSLFITSFWPPTMYAFATPAIGLAAARVAAEGELPYEVLSVMLLFYLVILFQMVKQAHVINMDSIALRFENLGLIDKLQEQKESAESANIAKSKFLAAASHDLRQPLHALSLFASALNDRIKFPEVRMLVENINLSVAALEDLFNTLLDVSRLDAGIVLPKLQHFRIKGVAERLNAEFTTQALNKGLRFQLEGPEVIVYSDPILLETMLRNLISNAIRFTASGEVKVVWLNEATQVLIEVQDTGNGIPAEDKEKIFHEFLQLNNPERDRNKGLGLGLSIVKRLAVLLQCTISVHSTVGLGSVFRLAIPLGHADLIVNQRTLSDLLIENEPGMLVLVIDDESTIREAMKALLGNWGHQVVVAGSLVEALQAIKSPPDAIIADYRLREGRTGIEAIQKLHQVWGSNIPALIVTGDTAPELLREAQSSGFSFMHKPVSPAKLRAFLRSANRHGSSPR